LTRIGIPLFFSGLCSSHASEMVGNMLHEGFVLVVNGSHKCNSFFFPLGPSYAERACGMWLLVFYRYMSLYIGLLSALVMNQLIL